jgi:transcription elongation factor SPT4
VARWQRLESYEPGLYAVQVIGEVPPHVLDRVEDEGLKYIPRDGTKDEDVQKE